MAISSERIKINQHIPANGISGRFSAGSGKNKSTRKHKSHKYILDQSILQPDAQLTYLEFLEKNPLRLSMQKLKGRMEYKPRMRMDLGRIEETYWSQWKPNKNSVLIESTGTEVKKKPLKTLKSIRGEGDANYNTDSYPTERRNRAIPLVNKQSAPLSKIDELTEDDNDPEDSSNAVNVEEPKDLKFLKHTDSFILNNKRQLEKKTHYQQPRCIRLYKKNSSGSYMKGGSYPLKPCLKKESTFRGYNRKPLSGRPYSTSIFNSVKNKVSSGSTK